MFKPLVDQSAIDDIGLDLRLRFAPGTSAAEGIASSSMIVLTTVGSRR
jgi:hypothetical protein